MGSMPWLSLLQESSLYKTVLSNSARWSCHLCNKTLFNELYIDIGIDLYISLFK